MLDLDKLAGLCQQTGAAFEPEVPLSVLTTFKIGGACQALVTVPDIQAVRAVTAYLRENQVPFQLIGRGSNLLCADEGYAGVIMKLGGQFSSEISGGDRDCDLHCGAGVSLKNLCLYALQHQLTGLEFAYGIPGSVGGAVYMNAGAYGGEIAQVLKNVTVLDESGEIRILPAGSLALGYRHSIFMERELIILDVSLELNRGDGEAIKAQMQDLIGRRKEKQPLEYPSAGSTFKRPEGSYASKLIDECGLKGYTVGGAQVSEKHAGFVINRGGATFADVMAVCGHVQQTVKAQTGYWLELEPEIIGADKK